jgi:hypothetical protein
MRQVGSLSRSGWLILSAASETDIALQRSTFGLMVALRDTLVGQGIVASSIELRLSLVPVTRVPASVDETWVRILPVLPAPETRFVPTAGTDVPRRGGELPEGLR